MAITPSYAHEDTLKKLNVNGAIYWLKDADLRALVETFGDAVFKDVDTVFDEDGVNLATEAATAAYIQEAIADITGAMHFRGVVTKQEGETDLEALARVITDPKAGDVALVGTAEYVYSGVAGSGGKWNLIGDEGVYETQVHAAATYVPKTTKVAGIDLADDITVAELEAASALDLKALAHKDSASGTVNDYVTGAEDITVAKADTYTVAGTAVAVPASYSALDVTPAGEVGITQTTQAAATYDKVSATTITSATAGEGQTANYTPAGSVTLPTFSASLNLAESSVATVTNAGTAYTITDGSATKGTDTTAKFAKKSLKAVINDVDGEQLDLIFAANTDTDYFADAVTAAGDITYVAPTISGALPTFGSKDVVIKTGSTATASADGAASFSGTGVILGASNAFETANATVTQPVFEGSFSGTAASVTPEVATTVNAAPSNATITVGTETKSITLTKGTKTVEVQ